MNVFDGFSQPVKFLCPAKVFAGPIVKMFLKLQFAWQDSILMHPAGEILGGRHKMEPMLRNKAA
jgi:hypothetical protein